MIVRPDHYVGVTTYTGDDATTHPITGLNFGTVPDFVWIKNRDQTEKHILHDTVRGIGNTLYSTSSDQADTGATYSARFKSFDFNGFTVGTNHSGTNSTDDFVAWCWKAGGNKNTFNVDDVGYASAADVNMSVGALNSSVYNQTQTWSNSLASSSGFRGSEPVTNAFDGDTSSICSAVGSGTITFTSPVTFSSDSTIRVVVHGGAHDVSVNGGSTQAVSAGSFVTLNFTNPSAGTFTITFQRQASGSDTGVRAVEIGGKLLVDNGVSVSNVPSIAPTGVSVGTRQGFSIIKYTGNGNAATIPHGLSQTPTFLIKKFVTASSSWDIWTPNIGADKRLVFSDAATSSTTSYQSVNASTFDVHAGNNDDTVTMIAYLWHDVPGLQKFGSYTGVNDTDGPFLELGFRPSVIMFKNISSSSTEWVILDSKRNGFNGTAGNNILFPSTTGDENATQYGDFLSNGWKFRINSSYVNSTDTFIYAAWAEAPTINLYGGQSNAR